MSGETRSRHGRSGRPLEDWLELPVLPCVALFVLATLLAIWAGARAREQVRSVCTVGEVATPYTVPLAIATAALGRIDTCSAAAGARGSHSYDFEVPIGTPVIAARSGVVVRIAASEPRREASARGMVVNVRHDDGTIAAYLHLQHRSIRVAEGERVSQGSTIGLSGGGPDGAALRFAVQACLDCATIPVAFRREPPEL